MTRPPAEVSRTVRSFSVPARSEWVRSVAGRSDPRSGRDERRRPFAALPPDGADPVWARPVLVSLALTETMSDGFGGVTRGRARSGSTGSLSTGSASTGSGHPGSDARARARSFGVGWCVDGAGSDAGLGEPGLWPGREPAWPEPGCLFFGWLFEDCGWPLCLCDADVWAAVAPRASDLRRPRRRRPRRERRPWPAGFCSPCPPPSPCAPDETPLTSEGLVEESVDTPRC